MKNLVRNKVMYASFTFLTLLIYFHLMETLGYAHNTDLRFFNGIIMFGGVTAYMYQLAKEEGSNLTYFQKLFHGATMSVITSAMFAAYMAFYMLGINPTFFQEVVASEPLGSQVALAGVPFILFIEGAVSGSLFTLMVMQYLKEGRATKEEKSTSKQKLIES